MHHPPENSPPSPPRRVPWRPALLALALLLSQPGCILVVLGLMGAPIAVGGVLVGAVVGTRTAYYNVRDFYDAISPEDLAAPEQVTLAGLRLLDIYRNAYRALERTLAPHRLTPEQYLVLAQLSRANGQRKKELAQNIGIKGFPLNRTHKELEEKGWVTSKVIERAARFDFVGATDEGREALERARPPLEHLRFEYLRRLSLDDRRKLTTLIAKAVGEPDNPAAGSTGGILGLSTGGEAEFLLAKHILATHLEGENLLTRYLLSDQEFQVITALWLSDSIGPRTLATITQLRRKEFDKLIAKLLAQDYVVRVDQVSQEGAYLLRLGGRGKKIQAALRPKVDGFAARAFGRLDRSEQEALTQLIVKMTRGVVS